MICNKPVTVVRLKKKKNISPSTSLHTFWRIPGRQSSPRDASFYAPDDMSGRRTHTLSSVLLASNLFLSAYCPAADSERYFVEDYFAVSAVSGAEIQANDLQCKTLPRQITKPVNTFKQQVSTTAITSTLVSKEISETEVLLYLDVKTKEKSQSRNPPFFHWKKLRC